MATLASVVSLMEATARIQRETAEVLQDLAARIGNGTETQQSRRTSGQIQRSSPVQNNMSVQFRRGGRRQWPQSRGAPAWPAEPLTAREQAVLQLLLTKLSLREIGREMFVSVNTVKSHTRAIYRKLGVSSRREAVQRGRELGLLPGLLDLSQ